MSPRRHRSFPASIRLPRGWRRAAPLALTVFGLAVAVVCERSGLSPVSTQSRSASPGFADRDDLDRYHDHTFRVVRVVDGDTIDIEAPDHGNPGTRIRLWGVDTPEVAHGSQPNMYFGPEARTFAERTLENKSVHIVLSPKRTRDRYGRLLAYVFLERGGTMLNELLVEEGMAYADTRFDHAYKKRFEDAEKRARKSSTGLWADVKTEDMPAWRQKRERQAERSIGP